MEILLSLLILLVLINIALTFMKSKSDNGLKELESSIKNSISNDFQRNRIELNELSKLNRKELSDSLKDFSKQTSENTKITHEFLRENFEDFKNSQNEINGFNLKNIQEIKKTVEKQLDDIRNDNTKQLTEMRQTVDEKLHLTLEKRLGESFKQVSERLEQVHRGLGEMQTIATGVGDLKKVLSNVKTRGILGEYQLGNILEQILSPHQYDENVKTVPESTAHVEYAIHFPGKSENETVWLPVDSKFPLDAYEQLLSAYDSGEKDEISKAQQMIYKRVESFAKEIREKYIYPPHTTDFGIMFLPVESLYAEIVRNTTLFEKLQREFHITVAGPTTLAALLNSFQMGFRTVQIEKKSSEVWKVLGAIKTEFLKFGDVLDKVNSQLNTASKSLNILRTTRTNVLERKLRDVEELDSNESKNILEK
jgi:DNA recombination protein RmuC